VKTTPRVQRKNTLQVGSENRAALKSALHNQGTQWYLVESTGLPPGFFEIICGVAENIEHTEK